MTKILSVLALVIGLSLTMVACGPSNNPSQQSDTDHDNSGQTGKFGE